MSVSAVRTFNAAAISPVTSIAGLQDLQGLLNGARDSANRGRHKEVYIDIILLSLTLVNAALNEPGRNMTSAMLAYQASTSALSVVTSIQYLVPRVTSGQSEESKYIAALVPHLDSVKRSMVAGLDNVIRRAKAAGFISLLRKSPFDVEADRIMKDMKISLNAFLFKVSFFTESTSRQSRDLFDDSDPDAHILSWRDIDLENRCNIPSSYLQYISPEHDFWDNTYQAIIGEKRAIVKTYPGNSTKSFARDLEVLRAARHSNLPLLFGFSGRRASVPFIAISLESYVPLFNYLAILSATSPGTALTDTWRMVLTMRSTVSHLASDGMVESVLALVDIVKSAVVDDTGKIVLAPRSFPRGHLYGPSDSPLELPLSSNSIDDVLRYIYADNRTYQSPEYVDRLPRVLRPVRYALNASRSIPLPPSSTQLEDAVAQLLSPDRWRGLPGTKRTIEWPIPADEDHYRPVVGDLGRFSRDGDGRLFFERFSNVQSEIGGYLLVDGSETCRISRNIWRFPFPTLLSFNRLSSIPVAAALNFLSQTAQQLSRKFVIPPADLVLVTETEVTVRWGGDDLEGQPKRHARRDNRGTIDAQAHENDGGSFVFVHLDEMGHILQVYQSQSRTPVDIGVLPPMSLSMFRSVPFEIGSPRIPVYVQIDDHELRVDPNPQVSIPDYAIGDVGYYIREAGGGRRFHVACNASPDLIRVCVIPWEGNECEDIGGGIWRSLPITGEAEKTFCLAWSVKGSLGLPYDLESFYLDTLASRGGAKRPPSSGNPEMVKDVFHQIQFVFSPQAVGLPLWAFVHFDDFARPTRVYWSSTDKPCDSPREPEHLQGCEAKILPGYIEISDPHEVGHNYQRVKGRGRIPHNTVPQRFVGQRIGDLGFWERDLNGNRTDSWQELGFVASARARKVTCTGSTVLGGFPCSQVTEDVWQSTVPCNPDQLSDTPWTVHVQSRWTETLSLEDSPPIFPLASRLAQENGLRLEDILIVTQVTTEVQASASADGFKQNDRSWDNRCYQYTTALKKWNSSKRSETSVKPNTGGRTGTRLGSDEIESDKINLTFRDWDLSFYAIFPPGGGCSGFWSCDKHREPNYQALAKLDLEGWQRPGCDVHVRLDVKRTSVVDHLRNNGSFTPSIDV